MAVDRRAELPEMLKRLPKSWDWKKRPMWVAVEVERLAVADYISGAPVPSESQIKRVVFRYCFGEFRLKGEVAMIHTTWIEAEGLVLGLTATCAGHSVREELARGIMAAIERKRA